MPPRLSFHPPLLNTACPWASTQEDLARLVSCPSTGAFTTRTSLIDGFPHDDAVHRYALFDPLTGVSVSSSVTSVNSRTGSGSQPVGSINSFGYSPLTLDTYLRILTDLSSSATPPQKRKTAILSVTGSPSDVARCYDRILSALHSGDVAFPLAMEINLSCPNIPGASPPAYDPVALAAYLAELPEQPSLPVGVKTPPFTHAGQFAAVVDVLARYADRVSFVTATNTLGSCVLFGPGPDGGEEAGGLAGVGIHPLSVGNVRTLRGMLDERGLREVHVVGVGGVQDGDGYRRMRRAGAAAVGLATGLGARGVRVFEGIERDVGSEW